MLNMHRNGVYRMPAEWETQKSTWIAWPHNKEDWPGKFNEIPRVFGKIISELSKAFNDNGKGLVIGFGSVSGLLGRKFNSHYAASKRALESYFESLAASQINDKIKIQFYILGYLETNLSFGKNLKLPKGSPKKLAELVYKKKNINFKKIYFPFWWGLIAFLLKIIPINFLIKLIKNSKS